MASLQVIKGPSVGEVFDLVATESVMGRYPFCDIVLASHTISRQHARIVRVDDSFYVEDMNSLNGTFLNGDRVRGRMLLKDQDRIRLYETLLLFHTGEIKPVAASEGGKSEDIAHTAPFVPPHDSGDDLDLGEEAGQPIAAISALEMRSGVCGGEQGQQQLRTVMKRMAEISPQTEMSLLLNQVLEAMLEIFPAAERAHILLVQQPGGRLELRGTKNRQDGNQTEVTMGPVSQKMAKRVIARGEAILIGADEDDESIMVGGSPSNMCAPLIGPSRIPMGILHVDAGLASQPLVEGDLNVLVSVGMIAGQAIEFAQMIGSDGKAAGAAAKSEESADS